VRVHRCVCVACDTATETLESVDHEINAEIFRYVRWPSGLEISVIGILMSSQFIDSLSVISLHTVSLKVRNFKLSVTLSNLSRFSNF